MRPFPDELRHRPFSRADAIVAEVSSTMLRGRRFVRIFPAVYRHRDHEMTEVDWWCAARLALPNRARSTGETRIRELGLDAVRRWPLHFVVEGDLHLDCMPSIFLHRTKRLPPIDDVGVTPAAAFIDFCRRSTVVEAIEVGDWLLHGRHMRIEELREIALAEPWRYGAQEALWVHHHLDARSRSVKESRTRAVLVFAGLPVPDVNVRLTIDDDVHVISDLVYAEWRTVVEYEGGQHQAERAVYVADIDRYAIMRRHDIGYVQVTHEKLAHSRTLVGEVYRELLGRGYPGPPPRFDLRWPLLFRRLSAIIEADRNRTGGA